MKQFYFWNLFNTLANTYIHVQWLIGLFGCDNKEDVPFFDNNDLIKEISNVIVPLMMNALEELFTDMA